MLVTVLLNPLHTLPSHVDVSIGKQLGNVPSGSFSTMRDTGDFLLNRAMGTGAIAQLSHFYSLSWQT